MIAWQKSTRSAGVRLETSGPSTTTAASTKVAPALTTSSLMAAKAVQRRPLATGSPVAEWRAACDAGGVVSYADFGVKLGD